MSEAYTGATIEDATKEIQEMEVSNIEGDFDHREADEDPETSAAIEKEIPQEEPLDADSEAKALIAERYCVNETEWEHTSDGSGHTVDLEKNEVFDEKGESMAKLAESLDASVSAKVIAETNRMIDHFRSNPDKPYLLPDWIEKTKDGETIHVTVAYGNKNESGKTVNINYKTWSHKVEKKPIEELEAMPDDPVIAPEPEAAGDAVVLDLGKALREAEIGTAVTSNESMASFLDGPENTAGNNAPAIDAEPVTPALYEAAPKQDFNEESKPAADIEVVTTPEVVEMTDNKTNEAIESNTPLQEEEHLPTSNHQDREQPQNEEKTLMVEQRDAEENTKTETQTQRAEAETATPKTPREIVSTDSPVVPAESIAQEHEASFSPQMSKPEVAMAQSTPEASHETTARMEATIDRPKLIRENKEIKIEAVVAPHTSEAVSDEKIDAVEENMTLQKEEEQHEQSHENNQEQTRAEEDAVIAIQNEVKAKIKTETAGATETKLEEKIEKLAEEPAVVVEVAASDIKEAIETAPIHEAEKSIANIAADAEPSSIKAEINVPTVEKEEFIAVEKSSAIASPEIKKIIEENSDRIEVSTPSEAPRFVAEKDISEEKEVSTIDILKKETIRTPRQEAVKVTKEKHEPATVTKELKPEPTIEKETFETAGKTVTKTEEAIPTTIDISENSSENAESQTAKQDETKEPQNPNGREIFLRSLGIPAQRETYRDLASSSRGGAANGTTAQDTIVNTKAAADRNYLNGITLRRAA